MGQEVDLEGDLEVGLEADWANNRFHSLVEVDRVGK